MRFRAAQYGLLLFNVGFIVFGALTFLFLLGAICIPNGRVALLIMTGLGLVMVGMLRYSARDTHAWIYIDSAGVKRKWLFGVNDAIAWDECADIGIAKIDVGAYGIHHWIYRLYFSKVLLTQQQVQNSQNIKLNRSDCIMVDFSQEVLNEVLKYVDREKIRNLHLASQIKSVFFNQKP
ncbi:hypothetical protein [Papillibacter cinnamivorans]|uniref:Uncharacterized protein n=1 Tax=Papillibacter cinnamivorans DSM 12816 TaxID=1122930 RepID=A0A1W2C268_9FIRM|nr:hypothetical protein [Papillibacter cinnamivorans]SMC78808.1 hypothetical protein SAMN02745168_2499 [Papillibacter cinnamivorans DSM 12816]